MRISEIIPEAFAGTASPLANGSKSKNKARKKIEALVDEGIFDKWKTPKIDDLASIPSWTSLLPPGQKEACLASLNKYQNLDGKIPTAVLNTISGVFKKYVTPYQLGIQASKNPNLTTSNAASANPYYNKKWETELDDEEDIPDSAADVAEFAMYWFKGFRAGRA